jgi:hypothetical protein
MCRSKRVQESSGVFKLTSSDLRCWWVCLRSACLMHLLKVAQKCSGGHDIIGHVSKEESARHLPLSLMPGMSLPLVWVRSNNVMTQRYERHMLHLIMTACVIPWRRDREDVSIMTIYIPFLTTSQLLCLGAAVQCYGTIGDIFSNERGDGTFLVRLSQRWT